MSETIGPKYGERYVRAVQMAADLHATQPRKGTEIPYLSHLLHVSALVWEAGGDEDAAIAALLHDAVEDQGRRGATRKEIALVFGPIVAGIVDDCSDAESDVGDAGATKEGWSTRKQAYLDALSDHSERTLLVVLADKLHNATSMLDDLDNSDVTVEKFWERFNAEPEGSIWFFHQVHTTLSGCNVDGGLLARYGRAVDALAARVGIERTTAKPVAKPGR